MFEAEILQILDSPIPERHSHFGKRSAVFLKNSQDNE